jgi:protein-tyrosine phosphatase
MNGLCDLHCHLLYGLDDGAKTLEDTLEMARALVDLGFSAVAPSPHNRPEYAPKAFALERLAEVERALKLDSIPLSLAPNSENFLLDERLISGIGTEDERRLGRGGYLLVEAPYLAPVPVLPEIIFRLKLKGVTPILAHPERCHEFERPGRALEAVRAGACLQLDVGALTGRYGPKAKKLARVLLEQGLYALGATDLHSPFRAREWVGAALEELHQRAGAQAFQSMMKDNPVKILAGEALV